MAALEWREADRQEPAGVTGVTQGQEGHKIGVERGWQAGACTRSGRKERGLNASGVVC